ncbi:MULTISPECIES: NB-ARC domain-containing protein [Streptomyces]|uniref:NB-ARC domain-containing protein n=1 Tax=Streptomyces ramulosus TaxID=47762 RepID=A0ABW1FQG4_9ACTN
MAEETRNSVGGQAHVNSLVQADSVRELHLHQSHEHRPPCQLPPEVPHFTDRDDEQALVLRTVREWERHRPDAERPLIVTLRGLRGVGKTTLGFRLARTLREGYPDGVLYVDLDGMRHDGGVCLSDVLARLLRDLGVTPEWVEPTFAGRAAQYWDRTQRRRLVVVIDNVRYASEAEPLLPASAGSVVILAGSRRLDDLEHAAAVELSLEPLREADAVRLLLRIVDDPELSAAPETAAELARLCAGSPAALRVAGRWVRRHRHRGWPRLLAGLATELREKGVPDIEPVWDAAYRDLAPQARRLYRLLAAEAGEVISEAAVAALLGTDRESAEDALAELADTGLVDVVCDPAEEGAAGPPVRRPRMHPLVRAHALRRARDDGDPQESADGLRRVVGWYLRQAQRADTRAAGPRLTLAPAAPPVPGADDVDLDAPEPERKAVAHRWLTAERRALHACVRIAHDAGWYDLAWALCEPLWTHLLDHPHSAGSAVTFALGRDAAQRAENLRATIRMRCQLARPLWEQRRFADAGRELTAAVHGAELLGQEKADRKLYASALEFRGRLGAESGRWAEAVPDYVRSRTIHREINNAYGAMLLTYQLGLAREALGELGLAEAELTAAHAAAQELKRDRMTARTVLALGRVERRQGRLDAARGRFGAALDAARRRGSTFEEARVLDALAELEDEAGRAEAAAGHRERAAAIRAREGGAAAGA